MLSAKFKGRLYHLYSAQPGVVYDQVHQRLSQDRSRRELGLCLQDAHGVLWALAEKSAKSREKFLTEADLHGIVSQNLCADGEGRRLSPTDHAQGVKGVNYRTIRHDDVGPIAQILESIRSKNLWHYHRVSVRYPGIKKIQWGRLARYGRLPWTKLSDQGFETIPLLIPTLSAYLLKTESSRGQ